MKVKKIPELNREPHEHEASDNSEPKETKACSEISLCRSRWLFR